MGGRDSPLFLALGGMVALAAAMGLGRFLLTPALPMMQTAGLGPASAGFVASANFAGYLAGALVIGLIPARRQPRPLLLGALVASALTTGAMGLTDSAWAWAVLRFLGGIASAAVLVTASAMVIERLQLAGRPGLGAVHFAGVGVGIAVSALISAPIFVPADGWRQLWLTGGAIALLATAFAVLAVSDDAHPGATAPSGHAGRAHGLWRLIAAYGCLGFGYVVTATFLVAILREGAAGRSGETLVWLLVGLAAAPSVALWTRQGQRWGVIRAYQVAMAVEAAGVALSAMASGVIALSVAAVALGGTFMGLTALGLQEAARRSGGDGRRVMGLMTAAFGLGQMIGPGIAGLLRETTGSYAVPSLMAATVLVIGAALVGPLARNRG